MIGMPNATFWQTPLADLTRQLDANANGLSSVEAAARLKRYGANTLEVRRRYSLLRKILSRFRNPLVLILARRGHNLGVYRRHRQPGHHLGYGAVQRAARQRAGVSSRTGGRATQGLGGAEGAGAARWPGDHRSRRSTRPRRRCPARRRRPGAGRRPGHRGQGFLRQRGAADRRILSGRKARRAPKESPTSDVAQATNAAFMGTSVVSGSAKLLLCATGDATQLGEISARYATRRRPPRWSKGVYEFGMLIVRLTMLLVLFVLLVNTLFHRPLLECFLFALALAVGLTPELLPMIVSVTLARGAMRMARQKVIVKRLAAIHDLGSMDVLCTDKTGTLTEAKIALIRHIDPAGADSERVLELAYLNSHFETGLRSPLDDAILEHAPHAATDWTKIDEVPFDFERRRVSVLVEREGRRILVVKGAPEDVLKLSSRYEQSGENDTQPLDAAALARAARAVPRARRRRLSRARHRLARASPRRRPMWLCRDEKDFVFAGFAAFLDPPKASAAAAIAALARSGIGIKILTGDNERVTQHVCGQLGIPVDRIAHRDGAFRAQRGRARARASRRPICSAASRPSQKNRIILALQASRSCRRISRRRHQRRALASHRRCRHLGRRRGRRREGRRGHDPARPRPGGASNAACAKAAAPSATS